MMFHLVPLALVLPFVLATGEVYTASGGQVYTVTQDTGADVPLASKSFDYPYLPYQADSGDGERGTQQGYNICNSTTLGASSWCQTAFLNSVEDFCLWGSPKAGEIVADVEEEMVAYCTNPTYGTRMIPPGAITGVQFVQTPDYVEIAGYIDQTTLDLQASDSGGEEDPHGDDERGNPLGSLLYSSAFGNGTASQFKQIHQWSYFIGGGVFCFKACDPSGPNAAALCQHIYDRIGCTYNDPVSYDQINGTFQQCKGEDMTPPGIYTLPDGTTMTYQEPPESLGVITTVPYTPTIPATSQCTTYTSASIYTGMAAYAAGDAVSGTSAATGASAATVTSKASGIATSKSKSIKSASASSGTSAGAQAALANASGTSSSKTTSSAQARFGVSRSQAGAVFICILAASLPFFFGFA